MKRMASVGCAGLMLLSLPIDCSIVQPRTLFMALHSEPRQRVAQGRVTQAWGLVAAVGAQASTQTFNSRLTISKSVIGATQSLLLFLSANAIEELYQRFLVDSL